jgi:hypothetical protein
MTYRVIFLFKGLFAIYFIACSATEGEKSGEIFYTVNAFDNTSIVGYNLISVVDNKNSRYIVLAKRFGAGVDRPSFDSYDTIKVGSRYKMHLVLNRIDTLEFTDRSNITKDIYFEFDGKTLLHNNKVLIEVYTSDDVFDRYIKR